MLSILFATSFCVMLSYSLARPAAESLFLQSFSQDDLMSVWLCTALCAAFVIGIYNRFVARFALIPVFAGASLASALMLSLLLGLIHFAAPGAVFALSVWKDLYIVLLVEIFWSYVTFVFDADKAKRIFGWFLVAGTLGSFAGNAAVGALVKDHGTLTVLWGVVPVLLACALLLVTSRRVLPCDFKRRDLAPAAGFWHGVRVVRGSSYLWLLLAIVALVQISLALIDYQFQGFLQHHYLDLDERTQVVGQLYAAIDIAGLFLQVLSSVFFRWLGVFGVMFSIPALLSLITFQVATLPSAGGVLLSKGFSKVMDYSLFRQVKEMLFIPLNREERTQGKAVIDVFTYRASKGLSALFLMFIVNTGGGPFVGHLVVLLCLVWSVLVIVMRKRYQMQVGVSPTDGALSQKLA